MNNLHLDKHKYIFNKHKFKRELKFPIRWYIPSSDVVASSQPKKYVRKSPTYSLEMGSPIENRRIDDDGEGKIKKPKNFLLTYCKYCKREWQNRTFASKEASVSYDEPNKDADIDVIVGVGLARACDVVVKLVEGGLYVTSSYT
ncbi:hypothetical protein PVK06_023561 [Gossypium arboreum]|uniref:Uncharacterized protein n=1 Tax=Gossypium arboreum TaxID=29729 RepID=A0ABR0PBP4_GOSAR|nr:hypothetical protein PVK06_023561 [Gossypium arboreum]